jgi:hypothetical protein
LHATLPAAIEGFAFFHVMAHISEQCRENRASACRWSNNPSLQPLLVAFPHTKIMIFSLQVDRFLEDQVVHGRASTEQT